MLLEVLLILPAKSALASDAYVVNRGSNTVSVFDTRNNQVVGSPMTGIGIFVALLASIAQQYIAQKADGPSARERLDARRHQSGS